MSNCDMIRDLLPLYADDVCSDESRRIVVEHLAECPGCKAELGKMTTDIHIRPDDDISVPKDGGLTLTLTVLSDYLKTVKADTYKDTLSFVIK